MPGLLDLLASAGDPSAQTLFPRPAESRPLETLMQPPRNPARMPEGLERAAADATVNPLWQLMQGVGAAATGNWTAPEVGAGMMAGLGLMSPAARTARASEGLAGTVAQGIRAFHGSPYDFAKFDLSKAGTGEGFFTQYGGRGLNFAEHEPTARYFQERLSRPDYVDIVRQNIGDFTARQMERARAAGGVVPGGRLYEVNINADPSQFLSMGSRINSQSPAVQQAFADIATLPQVKRFWDQYPATGQSGAKAFERLGHAVGVRNVESVLRDAGIVGTKQLDQMAKTQGKRANAYVVFDDGLVDIIGKR